MKSFKQFLENYDFYLDKPMGFKKPEEEAEVEITDAEDMAQEERANQVNK